MPGNALSRIDFSDNSYTVKQRAVRNAYKVYNSTDEEVLQTKQKLFKMKEEFPFKDPEGNDVFSVKAENIMDIAGDYVITDSETGEKIAVLKKNFSVFVHSWEIEDGEGQSIASIESRGKIFGVVRTLSDIADLLPHKYSIRSPHGNEIGEIKQSFTLIKDRYEIELNEGIENKEVILAAAITIDALEGN
jgi:uncharacterized protein YxjI